LKSAIKAEQDAKKTLSGAGAALKKAEAAMVQASTKLATQEAKVEKAQQGVDKYNNLLEEQNAKIAACDAKKSEFEARVKENEAAIEAATVEIARICAEARGPEMAQLLAIYQKIRDDLCAELKVCWGKMLSIEQHRKDRLAALGQKELDRRVQQQKVSAACCE